MRFTSLQEWLKWQETCHPKEMDFGLVRVSQVAERLGLFQAAKRARIVTVGGTNGKGSFVHTLENLLLLAGVQFGAYSSPHVIRYNERIRINGQEVGDRAICDAFSAIDVARGDISLTYFEFATLAALWLFKESKLDYWLLEVGLGGRLDATNMLDADLAVITSVDLDHIEWLGDTREAIATEKAGIFRSGKPVICLDPVPPHTLLSAAERLGCPILQLPRNSFTTASDASIVLADREFDLGCVELPKRSVAGALLAFNCLGLLHRSDTSVIQDTLSHLRLTGRLQEVRSRGRLILLDVAHNPAAIKYLVERLQARYPEGFRNGFDVIMGMMRDKDVACCLRLLEPVSHTWRFCTVAGGTRSCSSSELASFARFSDVVQLQYDSVEDALQEAFREGGSSLILVVGSFLTVGEALRCLQEDVSLHETA